MRWMILVAALAPLTSCGEILIAGDAGCVAYREARLTLPADDLADDTVGRWVAVTDSRMTGTCP
jgi:hypothetical protein